MNWSKNFVEWRDADCAYLSVAFTWQLQAAYSRACWLKQEGYHVRAGGPAVALAGGYLAEVAELGGAVDALSRHNPDATFTSRGCIRDCGFCAVPRIEGALVELSDWPVRPVVCDNNLLACSRRHFDRVIDSLKPLPAVDFNQGLDARLITKLHAERLAELDCTVRLAWDSTSTGNQFMRAYERLRKAHLPKHRIQVYVLIGWRDSPDDAHFRLLTLRNMGVRPNPMRFEPLDAVKRGQYVGPNWTLSELRRFMKYWSRLRYYESIPFEEWHYDSESATAHEWRGDDEQTAEEEGAEQVAARDRRPAGGCAHSAGSPVSRD